MSKVGGGGGGSVFMKFTIYIHSEILHSSFDPLTTKFWGAQPPLIKKWGGSSPPCPPRFSTSALRDSRTPCDSHRGNHMYT